MSRDTQIGSNMRTISAVVVVALIAGCSGRYESPTAIGSNTGASTTKEVSDGTRDDGLEVETNTDKRLTGSLSKADHKLAFDIERTAGGQLLATLTGSNGTVLLRAAIDDKREKVELGGVVTLDAPAGALLGSKQPDWSVVKVSGDTSALGLVWADPAFALIRDIPEALAKRGDVDLSILPPATIFAVSPADGTAAGSEPKEGDLLSYDPVGCGFCHGGCVLWEAACVAATWGIGVIFCLFGGVVCHASCAGGPCR